MFIVKVQGGLGNQLLQYSFGRMLTLLHKKEVAYDISFFEGDTKYTKRPYLLSLFETNVRIATEKEIKKAKFPYGIFSVVVTFFKKTFNKYLFKRYYVGYNDDLIPNIINKKSLYLEGFWQSYMYYKDLIETLSLEISLKNKINLERCKSNISFMGEKAAAIHIRRGDYVSGKDSMFLGVDYYKKAITILKGKERNLTLYVFSDDPLWVKENLGEYFPGAVYVSEYGLTDCEEFCLMKECRFFIIANSTFSWFSALLQPSAASYSKIVYYSKDWKNKYLNEDTHICPVEWFGI